MWNRHCPTCGGMRREAWIEDRMSELLPTQYFHIIYISTKFANITMGKSEVDV
ncbi:MAG: transposase zinc-binding domain-containing protein [Saprospiraceae bacterium]|nr:transposase zinc-binding domain-containing protein [Saprospiraceae bacterium]